METAPAHSKHSSMSAGMITAKGTQSFPAPGAPTLGGPLPTQPSKALAQDTGTEDKPSHHLQVEHCCPTKPSLSQCPLCLPPPLRSPRRPGGHISRPSTQRALDLIPNVTSTRGTTPGALPNGALQPTTGCCGTDTAQKVLPANANASDVYAEERSGLVHFFSVTKMKKAP